jgi:hypothetical protein
MKPLCIYHGNCADGFTSAWVVRRALGDVDFHAGVYQNPPPDVAGRDVILVDFSYKRSVLEAMRDQAASVLILDHHKTAEADLRDLAGVQSVFDMERSGARITWDHFFPNDPAPRLVAIVEDRDLWRFALPGTREIQANIFSYQYDFQLWDEIAARVQDAESRSEFAAEGQAIERKHFKDIGELVGVVTRPMRIRAPWLDGPAPADLGFVAVPVANLPYTLTSDAGHLLAKGRGTDERPEFPFAGCYWDTPDGRVFSLRSAKGGVDVGEVAKQYGGGGHRNASGFRVPFAKVADFEISA